MRASFKVLVVLREGWGREVRIIPEALRCVTILAGGSFARMFPRLPNRRDKP